MNEGHFHADENESINTKEEDDVEPVYAPLSAPTDLTSEGELITTFKRDGDGNEAAKDEAFSYLQEIAKTPLLTPEREKGLFRQFNRDCRKI